MNKDNPLKILQIVGAMNIGGTETMLMNIFRNIDRGKVHFDFVSFSDKDAYYDEEIKQLGGRVIKVSNHKSIQELVKVIRKYGPYDAVHSHTLFHCGIANTAARIAGVKKRIAHAHTTLDKHDSLIGKAYISCMRTIIKTNSTTSLACSKEAGDYLFGKNHKNSYTHFPNIIDYRIFLQNQTDKVNKLKDDMNLHKGIVIGHVGRFIESKNHQFLLKILKNILKRNIECNLLLVGDGDLRLEIEKQAKKKGLYQNIRFVGVRNDVNVLLKCMDVFVFPSKYEGLGLVLLEAQASGTPCIVSTAIQPEADLHLNLMKKLSLEDDVDVWTDSILMNCKKIEYDRSNIINAFKHKGYDLSGGIAKLISIYNG